MKALIVDDEPLARRELRRLLAAHPSIQIVGEAGDIDEAHERIESLAPGVVFLDIQMPGGSGFDLLAQLDWVPRWNSSSSATGRAAGSSHCAMSACSMRKATTSGCSGDRSGRCWGALSRHLRASSIHSFFFARTDSRSSIWNLFAVWSYAWAAGCTFNSMKAARSRSPGARLGSFASERPYESVVDCEFSEEIPQM